MGKGKRLRKQVNYGDGEVRGGNDDTWQDNISEYNSDFSMPSDEDQVRLSPKLRWRVVVIAYVNPIIWLQQKY